MSGTSRVLHSLTWRLFNSISQCGFYIKLNTIININITFYQVGNLAFSITFMIRSTLNRGVLQTLVFVTSQMKCQIGHQDGEPACFSILSQRNVFPIQTPALHLLSAAAHVYKSRRSSALVWHKTSPSRTCNTENLASKYSVFLVCLT